MTSFTSLRDHLIDASQPLSVALREAYVLARQLGEPKFLDWVQLELRGYPKAAPSDSQVPDYRWIKGRLFTRNAFRGDYVQVSLGDDELTEMVCRTPVWEPVPQIESYIAGVVSPGHFLAIPLTHSQTALLQQLFHTELHPVVRLEVTDYHFILDAVRDRLLEFTLDLERDMPELDPRNVTGNDRARVGDMFEHAVIHGSVVVQVAHSTTGTISQNIHQTADMVEIRRLLDEIRRSLSDWQAPGDSKEEALVYVEQISQELGRPQPRASMLRVPWKALERIAAIEGARQGGAFLVDLVGKLSPYLVPLLQGPPLPPSSMA